MSPGSAAVTVAAGGVVRLAATPKTHKIICAALALGVLAAMAPGVDATGCPADSVAVPDPGITPAGAGVTAVAVSGVANENYLVFPASATQYTVAMNRTVATQGDILLISDTQFVYAENVVILGEYTVQVSAEATALTGSRGPDLSTVDGSALAGGSLSTTNDIGGLVAHWTFDSFSSGKFPDSIGGNDFYVTLSTGIIDYMSSVFRYSMDVDATLGYSISTSTNTFSLVDSTQRCYSMWVKRNAISGKLEYIFAQPFNWDQSANVPGSAFFLRFLGNNKLNFFGWYMPHLVAKDSEGKQEEYESTDEWLHIALNFNQAVISLYVNGTLKDEKDNTNKDYSWNVDGTLSVGKGYASTDQNAKFNMDDFRIYDRALTGDEINRIYQEGQGIFAHGITGNMTVYNTPQAIIRYQTCGRASGCAADSLVVPDPSITPAVAIPGLYENYLLFTASAAPYTVAIDSTVATQGDVLLISGSKFVYAENVVIVGGYTVQVSEEVTALTGSRGPDLSTVDGSALQGESLSTTNDIGGLIAHYRFDGVDSGKLLDSAGTNHLHCEPSSPTIDSANKIFEKSVNIDTTGTTRPYIIKTNGNTLNIDDSTQRSYSFWVKRNSVNTVDLIFSQPTNFGDIADDKTGKMFIMRFDSSNELRFFGWYMGTNYAMDSGGNHILFSDTKWYHFVLIWKLRVLSLYVDGSFSVEQTPDEAHSWRINGEFEVGGAEYRSAFTGKFNMDDFRIYDRALTGEEIKRIYSEGVGIFSHAITGAMTEYNTPTAIIRYDTCGYPPPPVVIHVTQNVTFLLANGNVSHTRIDAAIRDSIREALAGNLTGGDTARVHVANVKDSPRRPGKEANMVVLVGGDDSDTPDGHAFMRHKADWVGAVVRQELEQNALVVCGCNAASFMDGNIQMSVPC